MAWAHVQSRAAVSANAAASLALAYTSNLTAGNLLVVAATCDTQPGPITFSISDSIGHTWTTANAKLENASLSGGWGQQTWYVANCTGGADTVTITITGTHSFGIRMDIHEYSGIATSTPLDKTAGNTGSSDTPDSSNAITTENGELIWGAAIGDSGNTTAGGRFTSRVSADGFDRTEDMNGAWSGTYSTFFSMTSGQWIAQMATFKISGTLPLSPLFMLRSS